MKRRSVKAGLPPGTLVLVGDERRGKVTLNTMCYSEENFSETLDASLADCAKLCSEPGVKWISADGIHDPDIVQGIGRQHELHPLVMEDIMSTGQRPKADDYESYIYVVVRMLYVHDETSEIISEQVSLVLGPDYVLSFEERPGGVMGTVWDRIKAGKGRIRKAGADFLLYALLDAIVDGYFSVLEMFDDRIETLAHQVTHDPGPRTVAEIHALKRDLIYIRKSIWPLREALTLLYRDEASMITNSTATYLRDVVDHTIHVVDSIESFRDLISGLLDTYLSSISNRMNEVMKTLTIIATIFIPLTFVAGVYGMNFTHMPELEWRWSYPVVWVIMILISLGMLLYFRRKKWL